MSSSTKGRTKGRIQNMKINFNWLTFKSTLSLASKRWNSLTDNKNPNFGDHGKRIKRTTLMNLWNLFPFYPFFCISINFQSSCHSVQSWYSFKLLFLIKIQLGSILRSFWDVYQTTWVSIETVFFGEIIWFGSNFIDFLKNSHLINWVFSFYTKKIQGHIFSLSYCSLSPTVKAIICANKCENLIHLQSDSAEFLSKKLSVHS